MTTAEILNAAADLIEPDGNWCQGSYALDRQGERVGVRSDAACCWCASGAITRVTDLLYSDAAAEDVMVGRLSSDVESWNDDPERTQSEVVQALRDAAKAAS